MKSTRTQQLRSYKDVKAGEIHVAADTGHYGHVVLDAETMKDTEDVIVLPFTSKGFTQQVQDINAFKLFYRYSYVEEPPDWVPDEVLARAQYITSKTAQGSARKE